MLIVHSEDPESDAADNRYFVDDDESRARDYAWQCLRGGLQVYLTTKDDDADS